MLKPTAILFDLDGLMIDSEQVRAQSFITVIRRHGGIVPELIPQVIGVRVLDNWKIFKDRYGLTADIDQLIPEGETEYTRIVEENMPIVMPGLNELVAHLKNTRLKRAVVSSSSIRNIGIELKKMALDTFFQAIISGDMLTHGKPDPEGYLLAANKLGVNPQECLVLEDAPSGIAAAKAAGMFCITIPTTYLKNGDFSQADLILKDLQEVIPFLV